MNLRRIANTNASELRLNNGTEVLVSYSTPVAAYVPGRGYIVTKTKYSPTTSHHINKWLGECRRELVPQEELDTLLQGA